MPGPNASGFVSQWNIGFRLLTCIDTRMKTERKDDMKNGLLQPSVHVFRVRLKYPVTSWGLL